MNVLENLDIRKPTRLCELMGRNRSDKGALDIINSWHNYTLVYDKLFNKWQNENIDIFELGLGTNNLTIPSNMGASGRPGASLYGWREYFSCANIYGADIDRGILFNEDRIKTFFCDQRDSNAISEMWNNEILHDKFFDIIIEDGLHEHDANVTFFENSIHKLKKTGYFIIEDIKHGDLMVFDQKIKEWKLRYPNLSFNLIQLPSFSNNHDNNLLIINYIN